jgi:hypothetical protein
MTSQDWTLRAYRIRELADILSFPSYSACYKFIKRHNVRVIRLGPRAIRVRAQEICNLLCIPFPPPDITNIGDKTITAG